MNGYKITSPTTLPDLSHLANQNLQWFRGDSEESYNHNISCNAIPPYGPYDISYRFNSHGFRSPELTMSSTLSKVAFYGCSIMLGYGLPVEDTIPILTVNGNNMAFNLGIAGASNDLIARTVISTVPIIKPDFVFIYWTYLTRREIYMDSGEPLQWLRNWKKQTVKVKEDAALYMEAQDKLTHFASNINNVLRNITLVDLFLKNQGIRYYWSMVEAHMFQFDGITEEFIPFSDNYLHANLPDILLDTSRDMQHPGVKTNQKIATVIKTFLP